ncbi:Mediator of RNA polymerase II transcription subunit 18 [Coniosporium tulheliwenetii]|uniref:Mediator of RNA polymerase II transcription subunit 18 n=1 Tax=Coniosporium tulheliwenetii TaxID=3383036 RepID=A0ACC2Z4N4_9PEZI|nr:Mediator of RNA polymerase II transcription subunit 18 [Cladosporium sp. JES 115]
MHELLLFGQVPRARHEQVLSVLTGVAAMPPRRDKRQQALLAQLNKDLYYTQLVQTLTEQDFRGSTENTQSSGVTNGGRGGLDGGEMIRAQGPWAMQFNDLPEPGDKRPVTLRYTTTTDVVDGNPHEYMTALGYSYVSEYVLEGHRLLHKDVVILLHRILRLPPGATPEYSPRHPLPAFEALVPLDPSGAYVLQACLRLQDGTKPEMLRKGTEELMGLKRLMKGVVDLNPANRLSLDTRVKFLQHKVEEKKTAQLPVLGGI